MPPTGLGPTLPGKSMPSNWHVAEDYSVVPSSFYRFDPYATPSGRPYVEGFESISPDVLQEIAKRWGETYARREAEPSPWRVLAMMADPGHPDRWPDNAPPRGWFNDPIVNPWSADRHLLGERAWPRDKLQDYMGNYIDAMANVPPPRHWYEDYSAIPFR